MRARFVSTVVREKAWIIVISISGDETVLFLGDVVNNLNQKKLKDKVRIVVGDQAISEQTCKEYEVDAYARDAWGCVKKVRHLLNLQKNEAENVTWCPLKIFLRLDIFGSIWVSSYRDSRPLLGSTR